MRSFIARHITYANAMATIAVFVALGGSTFAASYVITKSSQIKDGAVTSSDVKNSSLTGSDIKDSSITGSDINDKSLTPADFNGSVQGPAGPQGAQGPQGDVGPRGPSSLIAKYKATHPCPCDGIGSILDGPGVVLSGGLAYFSAYVANDSADIVNLHCYMNANFPGILLDDTRLTIEPHGYAPITLQAAVEQDSGMLGVRCIHVAPVGGGTVLYGSVVFQDLDFGVLYADQVGLL